jgi:hypothetical protein
MFQYHIDAGLFFWQARSTNERGSCRKGFGQEVGEAAMIDGQGDMDPRVAEAVRRTGPVGPDAGALRQRAEVQP